MDKDGQSYFLSKSDILPKIDLHVHFTSIMRTSTIWNVARSKGMYTDLEGIKDLDSRVLVSRPCSTLADFLLYLTPCVQPLKSDVEAVKRVAIEYCEDCALQNIRYSEIRVAPRVLVSESRNDVTKRDMLQAMTDGLIEGCAKYNIKVNVLLSCTWTKPECSEEVLTLCKEFRHRGVVGMDIAGPETVPAKEGIAPEHIKVFKEAQSIGLHCTAHAGEDADATFVEQVVNKLGVKRIGHGYSVVEDNAICSRLLEQNVHFEVCPHTSILAGDVSPDPAVHPLKRFVRENASFSLNRDNPLQTGKTLSQDYQLVVKEMGLSWRQIIRANLEAVRVAFLPEQEKEILLSQLKDSYRTHLGYIMSRDNDTQNEAGCITT